jgi:methylenetetrahydrofolate reductase (NADPH)
MEIWLNELAKRDIFNKVYILIGITPLKSAKMTHFMKDVPGVFVPKSVIERMDAADAKGGAQEEGVKIALEIIEKIRDKQGVNGLHIMPVGWEEIVPRIVTEAGLIGQVEEMNAMPV